jgi:hypothetical protein
MKHDAEWAKFSAAVHKRLEAGEREYGDGSFARPVSELRHEIQEEVLDICGWAFVLWCRVNALESK